MAEVKYISWTGIKTYMECPYSYYERYILRRVVPDQDQSSFLKGNALHHLLEEFYLEKAEDFNWIVEHAPTFWSREVTSVLEHPQQIITWSATEVEKHRQIYLGWAFNLAKILKRHNITPDRVQPEFKADSYITLGQHRLKLAGRIDMLVKGKNGYMILDLKSSKNASIVVPDQILTYALLTDIFLGDQLDSPVSHGGFLLPGFPEGKQVQIFETTQAAKENLKVRITEVLDNIKAERFEPRENKACWWCPAKKLHCPLFGGALGQEAGIVTLGGSVASTNDVSGLL